MSLVQNLCRIALICSDPDRLADFYESALGFAPTGVGSIDEPVFAKLTGVAGATARAITLRLGTQEIELIGVFPPGRSYPKSVSGRNTLFQHFAIVTGDMKSAYARLSKCGGWTKISTDGPQLLPSSSGGVTAFKFCDPEGHPLELIAFPQNRTPAEWQSTSKTDCIGIDHSAISVADTERSVKFYEQLGLRRTSSSLNVGQEQDKLDNIAGAVVEITALAPSITTPHVELLCYRGSHISTCPAINDIGATRLVMKVESATALEMICVQNPGALVSDIMRFENGGLSVLMRDPDGHLLRFETSAQI